MKLNTLFENFSSQLHKQHNDSSDEEVALAASSTKTLLKTENEKYRLLLDDSIVWKGHTLYRIQYKKDINKTNIKKDSLGGYIESLDNLSGEGECVVLGKAKVRGNAKVYGDATVYGYAQVYDNTRVFGDAWVGGNAKVSGNAQIHGSSLIGGNAQVYDNAYICGLKADSESLCIFGNSKIHGDAKIHRNIYIEDKDIVKNI